MTAACETSCRPTRPARRRPAGPRAWTTGSSWPRRTSACSSGRASRWCRSDAASAGGALVRDDGAAERAIDDRHLDAADAVERHLVPRENALRVGARLAVDGDAEHDVAVAQIGGRGGAAPRPGWSSGGMPLTCTPPQSISSSRISAGAPGGKKRRMIGIDLRVDEALERGVVGVGVGRAAPHPLAPAAQIVAESLTGAILEKPGEPPARRATRGGRARRGRRSRTSGAGRASRRGRRRGRVTDVGLDPLARCRAASAGRGRRTSACSRRATASAIRSSASRAARSSVLAAVKNRFSGGAAAPGWGACAPRPVSAPTTAAAATSTANLMSATTPPQRRRLPPPQSVRSGRRTCLPTGACPIVDTWRQLAGPPATSSVFVAGAARVVSKCQQWGRPICSFVRQNVRHIRHFGRLP